MGNMSEHHNLWMKVEMSEVSRFFQLLDIQIYTYVLTTQARVNLEKYVQRRNCRQVNMQLACKQSDKYQAQFKQVRKKDIFTDLEHNLTFHLFQMAECEKQNSFTPEEMEKIKVSSKQMFHFVCLFELPIYLSFNCSAKSQKLWH